MGKGQAYFRWRKRHPSWQKCCNSLCLSRPTTSSRRDSERPERPAVSSPAWASSQLHDTVVLKRFFRQGPKGPLHQPLFYRLTH